MNAQPYGTYWKYFPYDEWVARCCECGKEAAVRAYCNVHPDRTAGEYFCTTSCITKKLRREVREGFKRRHARRVQRDMLGESTPS